jgi:hypothetical protein
MEQKYFVISLFFQIYKKLLSLTILFFKDYKTKHFYDTIFFFQQNFHLIKYDSIQAKLTQHNDIQNKDTQHNNRKERHCKMTLNNGRCYVYCDIFIVMMSVAMVTVIMLRVFRPMRLCHPPDGSTSPKYKLLCFITTKIFLQREERTSF